MQTPTPKRTDELEKLLRRLRQRAFDNPKAADLIPVVKARLMPVFEARDAESTHRMHQRLLYLTE